MITIWDGIEAFVNLFQMFIIYNTFNLLYESRFKFKNLTNIIIIIMGILLTTVNHNVVIKDNIIIYLGLYVFLFLTTAIIFKGNIITKACVITFILLAIGFCEVIAAAIIVIITDLDFSNSYEQGFYRLGIMIISQTMILYIYLFIKYKMKLENIFIANKSYFMLITAILSFNIISLTIVIWMYGNINFVNNNGNFYILLITISITALSILEFLLFSKILKNARKEAEKDKLLYQYQIENKHYTQINEILDEMRIIKHNLKNSLIIIDTYNKSNQKEKLQKYIDDLLANTNVFVVPQIDEENIITSFLSYKAEQANSNGIEVNVENNLTKSINIDKTDICQVIGNIMDNAIEANEKNINKYIKISLYNSETYMIIKSENPASGPLIKKDNIILTTKKDIKNHGLGLKSIQKIAEKYDGSLDTEIINDIFNIKVVLLNE